MLIPAKGAVPGHAVPGGRGAVLRRRLRHGGSKSFIGMYALDFNQPIWVSCEDPEFHKRIHNIGANLD